jgi:2-succinylbenzoate--coA ligase
MQNPFSIFEAAASCPDQIGLRRAGEDYSFSRLATLTQNTIDRLRREKALPAAGRPMIIEGKNTVETIVLLYALMELNIPALMLHPKLTAAERYVLLSSIREIKDPLPEETVAVLFTSGTTGLPKPAIITRKMLWESAKASERNLGWEKDDCWQLCMSVTRIGGLSILTRCLLARKTLAISPLFNPESFVKALTDDQVTITSIVPTMLAKIFETYPDWRAPKHLRVILLGGSSANDKLLLKAHRQGLPIVTTYGMTETCSHVVMTPYTERFNLVKGSGKVIAGAEVRTRDGQIEVKSPMTTPGYWGREPLKGEWFETGDLGQFDAEGVLHVHARRHDLILSAGENVYPLEVENMLTRSPFIKEALVIGEPDETWGAIVCALIVPEKGTHPKVEDVRRFCKETLSAYKCPRKIAFVDALPVNSADKPDRRSEILRRYELIPIHYKH